MDIEEEIEKYKEVIQEFRQRVKDVLKEEHTDEFLFRSLKAKNFDPKKAETHLRMCLTIRSTYQLDNIFKEYKIHELMKKYGFLGFLGFDKTGAAVRYIGEGRGDYDGFVRCFSIIDICIYSAYVIESDLQAVRENNKKTGHRSKEEMLAILDLDGFTLQQMAHRHVLETGFDMMNIFQDIYTAEVLKRVIIINAPVFFSVAYNLFKPIMRANLIEKLEVYSSKESSAEALLRYIDPEVLPAFLGGQRVDENGDENCSAFIRQGGKIPEIYYKGNQSSLSISEPGVKELIVCARSSEDRVIDILEAGSMIRFEMVSDNNISLCLLYKKKEEEEPNCYRDYLNSYNASEHEELISPQAKIQSHLCPARITVFCERAGQYIIRFDNTFSWVTPKHILYRVQVLPPS